MPLMIKTITLLFSLTLASLAIAKDIDFSQMTESEQQATGINKLTVEEQEALLRWVKQKQQAVLMAERKKNLGLNTTTRKLQDSKFRALLTKQYSNQLGENFYQLDNGQIWKQISTGRISFDKDSPKIITIEPGFMGSWELRGDGNRSVKVKRIK
ncbi:MAG: hypothetical protein DWP95_01925 [Proteobacteria bacterium]|nr:MAG: hypothetical protein DWP95_01925 [Pseudomonadota bacterium]